MVSGSLARKDAAGHCGGERSRLRDEVVQDVVSRGRNNLRARGRGG